MRRTSHALRWNAVPGQVEVQIELPTCPSEVLGQLGPRPDPGARSSRPVPPPRPPAARSSAARSSAARSPTGRSSGAESPAVGPCAPEVPSPSWSSAATDPRERGHPGAVLPRATARPAALRGQPTGRVRRSGSGQLDGPATGVGQRSWGLPWCSVDDDIWLCDARVPRPRG